MSFLKNTRFKTIQLYLSILAIIFLSSGVYSQGAANPGINPTPNPQPARGNREPIPGIDNIDRAVDPQPRPNPDQKPGEKPVEPERKPEEKPVEPERKPEEKPVEPERKPEEKPAQDLPFIKNLKVELDPESQYSAKITWEVSAQNDTPVWVGRYIRPVTSKALVFEAYNLTSPALGPREVSFIDHNIPDGTYYYVVVTSREISREGTLVLRPDVNYTVRPFIVFRDNKPVEPERKPDEKPVEPERKPDEKPVTNEDDYRVFNLTAVNGERGVKLSWSPARARDIIYSIYRGESPLNSPEAVSLATRLGTVTEDIVNYEDLSPLADKNAHYAVTVTDKKTFNEFKKTIASQNWTQITFRRQQTSPVDVLPNALTAYQDSRNSAQLLWIDPEQEFQDFSIYRATQPIASEGALNSAQYLGRVRKGSMLYQDKNLRPGNYFYALIPRDRNGRELRELREGRTFTGFGISIRDTGPDEKPFEPGRRPDEKPVEPERKPDEKPVEVPEPVMLFLNGQAIHNDTVLLRWDVDPRGTRDFKFRLYRSENPMRNQSELRANGILVNELSKDIKEYSDMELARGNYYYALVIDLQGRIQEIMVEGKNFLKRPVVVTGQPTIIEPERKPDEKPTRVDDNQRHSPLNLDGLDDVIRRTYQRRLYGEAIRQMAPYIADDRLEGEVRAKAMFFTGLSYYYTGQYRSAVGMFVNQLVESVYPDRSRFWRNRAFERIR